MIIKKGESWAGMSMHVAVMGWSAQAGELTWPGSLTPTQPLSPTDTGSVVRVRKGWRKEGRPGPSGFDHALTCWCRHGFKACWSACCPAHPNIDQWGKCFKFLNNSLEQGYCLEWEIRQGDLHVFFSNSKQHNSVFFVCLFFPIFYGSEESISRTVLSNSLWPHSPPGSSAHGIVQARILEWVAISFPMYLPKLESPTLPTDSLPSEPPLMSKDGM